MLSMDFSKLKSQCFLFQLLFLPFLLLSLSSTALFLISKKASQEIYGSSDFWDYWDCSGWLRRLDFMVSLVFSAFLEREAGKNFDQKRNAAVYNNAGVFVNIG